MVTAATVDTATTTAVYYDLYVRVKRSRELSKKTMHAEEDSRSGTFHSQRNLQQHIN